MIKKHRSPGVDVGTWRGDWALVTGASEGLGEAFARRLAKESLSLVLVARGEERLRALAAELEASHGISTLVLARDLSTPGAAEELVGAVRSRGIRVRLLINNAASIQVAPLERTPPETLLRTIHLNVATVVQLCSLFHPDLASYPRSAILNVASIAAHFATPLMANYSATKAFLKSFGMSLFAEWISHGIVVQTLLPGVINTNMNVRARYPKEVLENIVKGNGGQKPETVVAISMKGLACGEPLVYTRWQDGWMVRLAALVPVQSLVRAGIKLFMPTTSKENSKRTG